VQEDSPSANTKQYDLYGESIGCGRNEKERSPSLGRAPMLCPCCITAVFKPAYEMFDTRLASTNNNFIDQRYESSDIIVYVKEIQNQEMLQGGILRESWRELFSESVK
jgi:hypothetical protein